MGGSHTSNAILTHFQYTSSLKLTIFLPHTCFAYLDDTSPTLGKQAQLAPGRIFFKCLVREKRILQMIITIYPTATQKH